MSDKLRPKPLNLQMATYAVVMCARSWRFAADTEKEAFLKKLEECVDDMEPFLPEESRGKLKV